MKFRQPIHVLLAFAILTLGLTGCGGKGGSTPPPTPPAISVALSGQPATSLTIGATTSITAVVSNDSANGGVKWAATCGSSSACGSFSPTTTASGAATVYTAPTAIPSGGSVTVTATSVTDSTKSTSAVISVVIPPGITVSFSPPPPAAIGVNSTSNLTAVVTNDGANGGVNWTLTCTSSPCGSLAPTTTASGTATVYSAPSSLGTANTVTVTATSVLDPTKSASASFKIAPITDGTYVFNLSGQDNTGPYFVAGAFIVNGGVITGGEQDFSNYSYLSTDLIVAAQSSLSLANGNIQVVIATANTQIGVNGVETLRATRVSNSRALLSEFDIYAPASGSLDLQTSIAAPSGGYAFVVSGVDGSNSEYPFGLGGILNINGTSLSTSNSIFDFNDGGTFGQALTFASGSVSAPDSLGRVTFTLTPATAAPVTVPQILLTGYIISPNHIRLIESQVDSIESDVAGEALGQGSNTNSFSAATLANTSYVYGADGADLNGSSMIGGVFAFNSGGALTGQMALNDQTNFTPTPSTISGSYTVDATGRATLSNVVPASLSGIFEFTIQLYLDGNGNALQLGVDNQEVMAGPAYLRSATTADFEGRYALGGTGLLKYSPTNYSQWSAAGPVSVNAGALTGTTDYTVQSATPYGAQSLTGTENSSTGILNLTGLNAVNFAAANSYAYFRIDSTRVLAIENDGQMLGLLTIEGVH